MLSNVECLFEVGDGEFKLKTACLIVSFFSTNFSYLGVSTEKADEISS